MNKPSVELGTDTNGIRFTFNREDRYLVRGQLDIDVWDAEWHEAANVVLSADDALTLAQTLDDWLDR